MWCHVVPSHVMGAQRTHRRQIPGRQAGLPSLPRVSVHYREVHHSDWLPLRVMYVMSAEDEGRVRIISKAVSDWGGLGVISLLVRCLC